MTWPLTLRLVTIVGASAGFFLLLSVVPLYAEESGGGSGAAGLSTSALMLATVCGELAAPRLTARFGYRLVLATGLVLLGAPSLLLTVSPMAQSMGWIVAVCLVRGAGFALTVVGGGALTAVLIPPERRGEGLALVGVVSGAQSVVALPLGVWLARHAGFTTVFVLAAVLPLATVPAVAGLPRREAAARKPLGMVDGFRTPALALPAAVFGTTALGAGIIATFLPLAVPPDRAALVSAALFLQAATAIGARWVAGRYGDRHGPAGLVVPGLLLCAGGMLATAPTGSAAAVLVGMALFGTGFGIAQNATQTLMYARVPPSGYGVASALWNFAYDAGMGLGAVLFGLLSAGTGYAVAFAATGALMTAALVPAWYDHRLSHRPTPTPGVGSSGPGDI
ncbi:MFS transporter [Streptomyces dioscori]|uniref:MFS transporter n=1 Tax=Streptomyces dioscori TaxID=2109333 RepID=A0A2P8Q0S6_9ACTN|nr:MFS transporter [Streptomyces dioscori]PSM39850.1 MFS transporter [Streptomyces dioscori]